MRIIDEEWIGCTKSRVGKIGAPVSDWIGGSSADEHAIAVAVEAVFSCYGVAIGAQDVFLAGEGGDEGEEAGLREMEIGEELIYYAQRLARVEENRSCGFSGGYGVAAGALGGFFGGVFQGADYCRTDGEDWSLFFLRLHDSLRGGFGNFVRFDVDFVVFEALRADWLESA